MGRESEEPSPTPPPDPHDPLLAAARLGGAPSVETLIRRHEEELRRRIRWLMGPKARAIAESVDFMQQMLVEALARPERIPRRDDHFVAFLVRIARNNIADAVRRKRARSFDSLSRLFDRSSDDPERHMMRKESRERLLAALKQLPADRQTVIELRHLEQLHFQAIAERMQRTETAVERLHARALMQLGRLLRTNDHRGGA